MNPNAFPACPDSNVTQRKPLIAPLNRHVITLLALHSLLKRAHWNVQGSDFSQLQDFFNDLASDISEHLGDVAKRTVQRGEVTLSAVQIAARDSKPPDCSLETMDG